MIQLFAFDLDVPPARVAELERLLSPDEAHRASRFRQHRDYRRYVVHRAETRTVLGASVGQRPERLRFEYSEHGKPRLHPASGGASVRFNMSRSHEVGVLAMQLDADLGIDVEQMRAFPAALDIAARFFTPEENARLRALTGDELDAAFFSYWTRKEAIGKSLGLGLSHPFDSVSLTPCPGPDGERILGQWVVPLASPVAGYAAAIAAARQAPTQWC
jgi:4'-phosphopantetheinyl transferase